MIEQVVFESPIYEINKLEDVLYPFGFSSGDLVPLKLEMIKVYVIDEMNLESRQLSVDEFTFSKDGVRLVDFVTLTESRIQIVLDMAIAQELDLKNQTVLSLSNTEKSLDKMTLMMLTLKRLVKQCVSAPVGVAVKGYEDFVAVYNLCKAEVVKASKQADRAKEQADIAKEQGDRAQEHVAQAMKDVVIDSLTSTDVTKPLSAKQGMVLNSYKAEKMNPNLDGHLISSLGSDGDVSALVGSETFQMRVSERNNGAQTFIFDREGPRFDLGALGGGKNLRVNNSPVLLAWDVMDNLESNLKSNPLSANQGCLLKGFIDVKADSATTYDKTQVDTIVSEKADVATTYKKTEVDTKLAVKADKVTTYDKTQVDTIVSEKADKVTTYDKTQVDTIVSEKADSATTYDKTEVDTKLETKADVATTYLKTEVDTKLNLKADKVTTYLKTEVDTKLVAKADKVTTYEKSEVDSKLAGLTAGALIFKGTWNALTNVPVILTAPKKGEFWIVSYSGKTMVVKITLWKKNDWVVFVDPTWAKVDNTDTFTVTEKTKLAGIQEGAQINTVTRVAGKTGDVGLVKEDVGLSNVDNTSDINKPVSTAVQMALSKKADKPAVATPASNALTWTGTTWGTVPISGVNSSSCCPSDFKHVASGEMMPLSDTDSVEYCCAFADRSAFTLPNGHLGRKQILYLRKSEFGSPIISPSVANHIWEINGVAHQNNEMPDLSEADVFYVILYDGISATVPIFPQRNEIILSLLCTINQSNQHEHGVN